MFAHIYSFTADAVLYSMKKTLAKIFGKISKVQGFFCICNYFSLFHRACFTY